MMRLSRMTASAFLVAGMIGGGLMGCGGEDEAEQSTAGTEVRSEKQRVQNPQVDQGDKDALVAGNTAFALDLYRAIAADDSNLFFSPLSISEALAMTYAGARGETEEAMAETLHFSLAQEQLHPAFNWLDDHLMHLGREPVLEESEPFELAVANAIWGQKDYHFELPFLDTLALNYGAGLRVVNFMDDTEGARQTINRWVEEETRDRIKNLLPEGILEPTTRLVLTNAIYFKASWRFPFEEEATRSEEFYKVDGSSVSADFMHQVDKFKFADVDGVKVVELPYDGGDVSMVLVLPEELGAFEADLDADGLGVLLGSLSSSAKVDLMLPKFEFTLDLPLTEVLQDMGMEIAFGANADFSGMTGDRALEISDVVHKAFVAIDESGTEAAAATAVVMGETAAPEQPEIVEFHADKPFIFVIRDNKTHSILFMGRVLDPTE